MSQKEFQRVKVIENAAGGKLSVREASRLLCRVSRVRATVRPWCGQLALTVIRIRTLGVKASNSESWLRLLPVCIADRVLPQPAVPSKRLCALPYRIIRRCVLP